MYMKFEDLIQQFKTRPFFETSELLVLFDEPEAQIMARLSRWVKQNKLLQLRRGKYLLADSYQKYPADPFYISNYLYPPSFISLYTALHYYGCIPEEVHRIQAVTSRQTKSWDTHLGRFQYVSTQPDRFFGYTRVVLGRGEQQLAYIADLERALLDVCYFSTGEWTPSRWKELRLQNVDQIDLKRLQDITSDLKSLKLSQGVSHLIHYLQEQE